MDVIVHRIRLRPGVSRDRFETWVRERDYAACAELPSVVSFSVQRVAADPAGPAHYFEIIAVRDREQFGRDMESAVFAALAEAFERMAVVVDECAGTRIEPGYAEA
ncbi:MAG: RedY protein [Actinocrinis sp.]